MLTHHFFIQLVLILLAARFLGEFVARFNIPSVIGELLAGVILGPSLLDWIEPTETIKLLAEIGVVLLLFEVGIETNIARLKSAGANAMLAAAAGVIAPFFLGFGLAYFVFQLSFLAALFIGSTLTATSIGITMRVLHDMKKQHEAEGQIVLGAAVIDDIIGVVLLAMLFEFASGDGILLWNSAKILGLVVLFMLISPFVAKAISSLIQRYDRVSEIPGLLPASIVSLLLFFAWASHQMGAPELLGGFAAGLALSRQFVLPLGKFFETSEEFTHRVESQMRPIVHLFTPIFFVTVGLSLDLTQIDWSSSYIWALSLSLLVAAIVGKLCSGFVLKEPRSIQWGVGFAMIPRGEVGLIFAEVGRRSGVFDQPMYAAMIIVIALTTLLAPFALRRLYTQL